MVLFKIEMHPLPSLVLPVNTQFTLGSKLEELTLYETSLESSSLGGAVSKAFEDNPLLPGILVTE